jgi:DNA-binding Lrp family transcriptional regulator
MAVFKSVSGYKAYISETRNELADLILVYLQNDPKEVLKKIKAELKSYHEVNSFLVVNGRNSEGTPYGDYAVAIRGVPIETAFALPDWKE